MKKRRRTRKEIAREIERELKLEVERQLLCGVLALEMQTGVCFCCVLENDARVAFVVREAARVTTCKCARSCTFQGMFYATQFERASCKITKVSRREFVVEALSVYLTVHSASSGCLTQRVSLSRASTARRKIRQLRRAVVSRCAD